MKSFPDASVYLKTKHNNIERNELWQSFGFIPLSEEEENDSNRVTAPFVIFSAPLTSIPDYAKEVQIAIQKDWDSNSDVTKEFVFTGSRRRMACVIMISFSFLLSKFSLL